MLTNPITTFMCLAASRADHDTEQVQRHHPVEVGEATAVEVVIAAALCPARFSDLNPTSAQFLLTVSREELLRSALSAMTTGHRYGGREALGAIKTTLFASVSEALRLPR